MTREEWAVFAEAHPLTDNQLGALCGTFRQLGFGEDERDERLAACAALLGLDSLDSIRSLSLGQAGQLYRMLLGVRDRSELPVPGQAAAPPPVTIADLGRTLALVLAQLREGPAILVPARRSPRNLAAFQGLPGVMG